MKKKQDLERELYEAGVAHRRNIEGFNDGTTWGELSRGQRKGWEGVARYVAKHFARLPIKPNGKAK